MKGVFSVLGEGTKWYQEQLLPVQLSLHNGACTHSGTGEVLLDGNTLVRFLWISRATDEGERLSSFAILLSGTQCLNRSLIRNLCSRDIWVKVFLVSCFII